jgi:hypothetical protein
MTRREKKIAKFAKVTIFDCSSHNLGYSEKYFARGKYLVVIHVWLKIVLNAAVTTGQKVH